MGFTLVFRLCRAARWYLVGRSVFGTDAGRRFFHSDRLIAVRTDPVVYRPCYPAAFVVFTLSLGLCDHALSSHDMYVGIAAGGAARFFGDTGSDPAVFLRRTGDYQRPLFFRAYGNGADGRFDLARTLRTTHSLCYNDRACFFPAGAAGALYRGCFGGVSGSVVERLDSGADYQGS